MTRLIASIALVRAAGLEDQTTGILLPAKVADRYSIPRQYWGHVAVALRMGLLDRRGKVFDPDGALNRVELAEALSSLNE